MLDNKGQLENKLYVLPEELNTSLSFALTVLAVCTVLMLVTMYDSFNKRDII